MLSLSRILKICWPYFIIAVSIVVVYFPTFSGEFILDDRPLIEKNAYIKAFHSPISYLTQEDGIVGESKGGGYHTGYYRPLINLTYSLDYHFWGLNTLGFRLTNLVLHICCCFILFSFLQFLIKDRHASLWATLIFAIHPINTEAVSWVVNRNNIMVTAFSISALLFYIKGWKSRERLNWVISVLTFSLALLSKEMGLMVIPILFLYQRLLGQPRKHLFMELASYLPFIVLAVTYFFLRKSVISAYVSPLEMAGLWHRIYFAPFLMFWNLKLILIPTGLHSFIVDYPSTYLNWKAFAGFSYIALSGVFIWKMRRNRLMIFSLLSFYVALFPILNIFPHSGSSLLSGRWLYFPLAFLIIMFTYIIKYLLKNHKVSTISIIFSLLVYLGSYSYILNSRLWLNEENFFKQEVLGFHNYYYAGGFAEHLFNKLDYQRAEAFFQLAIKHYPQRPIYYINYSALLIDTDRPDAALAYLEKAKLLFKTPERQGKWFNNMGAAHFRLGNYEDSLKNFLAAVNCCPDEIEFQINLGGAHTAVGDNAAAISVLEKTLELAPHSAGLRKNLALNFIQTGRYKEAKIILKGIPKNEWGNYGINGLMKKVQRGLLEMNKR